MRTVATPMPLGDGPNLACWRVNGAVRPGSKRRADGFTLVEAMISLAVFVIGGIACTETMGILNRSAAANRAGVAAQTLLAAKINKLTTTNYDIRSNVIPAVCDPSTLPPAGTNVFNGVDVGGPDTFNSKATDGYSADTSSFWKAVAQASAFAPPTGTTIALVSDANNQAIVTGSIYYKVATFESYTHTVEVTYSIVYAIGNRTFVAQQSLIRSPDVQ